jgi:hypothetical protein
VRYDVSINVSQRYSPELQKKALASREQRQKDFDGFVNQLKDLSKSDKPSECGLQTLDCLLMLTTIVWIAQKEHDAKVSAAEQQRLRDERDAYAAESRKLQQDIRNASQ